MKKRFIILSAITWSGLAFSQVGVNTPEPKATLEIVAKNDKGTSTNVDGIVVPRVDRQRAQSMTNVPISTLLYINDITTGTQTGTAELIDLAGYYYFDGRVWAKLNPVVSGIDQDHNIYNSNGALLENRIVNQTDKTLSFLGTAVNAFSVAGNTFSVDAANNRIGFGTASPSSKFEIVADNAGGADGNNFYFKGFGNSKEPALLLASANGTEAAPANLANGDNIGSIYFTPRANNIFNTSTGSAINSYYRGNGNSLLTDLIFRTSNNERLRIDQNGNVGIGTSDPKAKFDLVGTTLGIRNAEASGSWDNLWFDVSNAYTPSINASGAETGLQFKVGKNATGTYGDNNQVLTTVATMSPEGNMGIGTATPSNSAVLELSATNRGFLPPRLTTAQRDALANRPAGLMIYNTQTNCMEFWNSASWVSTCAVTAPSQGTIDTINCAGAANAGTLSTTTAATGVSSSIPYTGGNGGSHGGQSVASTGVTGLTATLSAGSFNNGTGTLTYTITGTPSAAGTASFALNIGGRTCTLSRTVSAAAGAIATLNCGSATNSGTLSSGVAASGVSSSVPYSGGNGGSYSSQSVPSTGVGGLVATVAAGNFANGNGSVTYTITGTPTSAGTASFTLNLGGSTCTLTRTVANTVGTIAGLDCDAATKVGTLAAGATASGVTFTIPYSGGNGGSHTGQTVQSTNVPGLIATLTAGSFANGSGTLTYTVTGMPTAAGSANFAINIGGRTCTVSMPVEISAYLCGAQGEGFYPDPNSVNRYYQCVLVGGKWYYYVYTCPPGSGFNPVTRLCTVGYGQ